MPLPLFAWLKRRRCCSRRGRIAPPCRFYPGKNFPNRRPTRWHWFYVPAMPLFCRIRTTTRRFSA